MAARRYDEGRNITSFLVEVVLAVVKSWAVSGAAGLQESNGDEFRCGSQSVPIPINRTRGDDMTATYTFDVFSSLDGYGSASAKMDRLLG